MELYGPKHGDVLVSMHNLSMTHHAAGRTDEAVELQEGIARIGEELGMLEEELVEEADGVSNEGVVGNVDEPQGDGKSSKKTEQKEGEDESEESATTWRPEQNN